MNRAEDYIRRLADYYRGGVLEIELIAEAEGQVVDALDAALQTLVNNQFIMTADSQGLSALEALYGLGNSPNESIEFRRKRLIEEKSKQPPFTYKWLQQRLDVILDGEYVIERDVRTQSLKIYVLLTKAEFLPLVADYIINIIPVSMIVSVDLLYNTYGDVAVKTYGALAAYEYGKIPITPMGG